jgi:tyrosyl-tRNA synthetase
MPTTTLADEDFVEGSIGLLDLLVKTSLVPSKKEGRRLVEQGGIEVNGEKINDVNMKFEKADFENEIIIKKGKKTFNKITL